MEDIDGAVKIRFSLFGCNLEIGLGGISVLSLIDSITTHVGMIICNTGYWILDTGYRILDTGYWLVY